MGKDKKPPKKKPGIPKPAKPARPTKPSKPKVDPPAKKPADAVPGPVNDAFDKYEGTFFTSDTTRTKDSKTVLKSPHGYFRVYEYNNRGKSKEQEIAVFFFNKRTERIQEVHGHIAKSYIDGIKNRDQVDDFPITDEIVAQADSSDRISGLSLSAIYWKRSTDQATQRTYKKLNHPATRCSYLAPRNSIPG